MIALVRVDPAGCAIALAAMLLPRRKTPIGRLLGLLARMNARRFDDPRAGGPLALLDLPVHEPVAPIVHRDTGRGVVALCAVFHPG